MSKPDDIPAQLLVDAREALADSTGIHPDSLDPAYVECMAYHMHKAAMAERERCAAIADRHEATSEWRDGEIEARLIAAAIRKGE